MEYYTAVKNNDIIKFAGKCMELEKIILSELTQTQKNTVCTHLQVNISYKGMENHVPIHSSKEAK